MAYPFLKNLSARLKWYVRQYAVWYGHTSVYAVRQLQYA